MKYYLSQDKIEEIRESADIIDIIGEYIHLKKTGKNFTGLCPFHSEKKPSFTVSPAKQLYHCFGCGASGNVITFIMNYESVSFIEAIEIIAKKYGITFETKATHGEDERKKGLLRVNDFAFKFFRENLKKGLGKKAMTYLRERGINDATLEIFGIGYAPRGWSNLINAARKNGIPETMLHSAGLIVKNEKGNLYDTFRGRIIFTFYNTTGKKIGFAGRTLGNDTPKYLNIAESPLFKKRYTLYGIYQGKEEIRKTDRCFVVEGYMDLLTLYQAGFKNTVAVSGTSLTDEQAKLIRKYTRNIYISFDADKPGKSATLRGISIFVKNGLVPYIITLKKGKDPDEIVKKDGKSAFQKLVNEAAHFIDFKMSFLLSKYDLNDVLKKTEVVKEMSRTISQIKDITERQIWLDRVSKRLSVDESLLIDHKKGLKTKDQFIPPVLSLKEITYDLIALLAMKPEKYDEVFTIFTDENLLDDTSKRVLSYIEKKIIKNKKIDIADVINMIEDDGERKRVSTTIFNIRKENLSKMINQYINRIKALSLKERWKMIKKEIQEKEGDSDAVHSLLQEQRRIASILKTLGGNIG